MKDKQVNIKAIPGELHFLVEFVNTLGEVVGKYKFYNYIDNGDSLSYACSDWVNYGQFPANLKGLVKLDNLG